MIRKFAVFSGLITRQFTECAPLSAGHAKWQNIKHRKARQDASRSTMNTKVAHTIYVAAREGGGVDPALNIRLATAIENASKMSVPKKVIEGAIARATKASGNPAENAQSISYEGIGPGGVAYIIEALTENKNRTAQQVRAAFLKYKGSLSPTAFLFKRRGWIDVNPRVTDYHNVFETCLEIESIDDVVQYDDQSMTLYMDPADLTAAAKLIREKFGIDNMGLAYIPDEEQAIEIQSGELLQKLSKFEEDLGEIEDVNNIYNNLRNSKELLE